MTTLSAIPLKICRIEFEIGWDSNEKYKTVKWQAYFLTLVCSTKAEVGSEGGTINQHIGSAVCPPDCQYYCSVLPIYDNHMIKNIHTPPNIRHRNNIIFRHADVPCNLALPQSSRSRDHTDISSKQHLSTGFGAFDPTTSYHKNAICSSRVPAIAERYEQSSIKANQCFQTHSHTYCTADCMRIVSCCFDSGHLSKEVRFRREYGDEIPSRAS